MKLGLIGCGKMGGALLRGVIKAGLVKSADIAVCDKLPEAAEALAKEFKGLKNLKDPAEIVAASEVILLAVKPQDMQMLLQSAAENARMKTEDKMFLSIAAGVPLKNLEAWVGGGARVIRAMPNTPALVLQGASAYARGSCATDADASTAQSILGVVGAASEVAEPLLDVVTGLSGSGPAYVYTVIEALADGGVLMGLPRAAALRLAAQTVAGAAQMVLQTGRHPAALRDEVTSPGGTTIAGLEQLEKLGLRNALVQAVRKATERSRELGKG